MPESIGGRRAESQVIPIVDLVPLITTALTTGAQVACPEGTRGLLIGTAGLQSITVNGTVRNLVPFQAGVIPIYCEALEVNASNTAANIFAVL